VGAQPDVRCLIAEGGQRVFYAVRAIRPGTRGLRPKGEEGSGIGDQHDRNPT